MPANEAELIRLIDVHLAVHGFKRIKKIWYLESDECYALLELDKGTWRPHYALEVSVMIKALDIGKPAPNLGHLLGWGLNSLVPDQDRLNTALALSDQSMTDSEKDECITSGLNEYGIPFLKRIHTIHGLKDELIKNKRLRYHTSAALWEYLALNLPRRPKLEE